MYRIALALALLATPAAAKTYTRGECGFIEKMLDNCTIQDAQGCEPIRPPGIGRSVIQLVDKHPTWDIDKFHALCQQVCDGKLTALDALYKYCPWRRRDLIREDQPPYD